MLTFIDKHDPITVKTVDKDFVAVHDGRRLEIKSKETTGSLFGVTAIYLWEKYLLVLPFG